MIIDETIDFDKTRTNVERLFSKYRTYKLKINIICTRNSSNLSNDNLGIFSSTISNPTENKVEQMIKYEEFIDKVDQIYKTFSAQLNKEEKVIYKKTLITKHSDETVMEELMLSGKQSYYTRKRSCFIKVAMWFDLEVYK